jgi:hypothetical protein
LLTQPDFDVASFNQVIAEVALPTIDPGSEPYVLISTRPSFPGGLAVEYKGDIEARAVLRNSGTPTTVRYVLQFYLTTPPQPPGSPGPDPAPPGSQVMITYSVVYVRY